MGGADEGAAPDLRQLMAAPVAVQVGPLTLQVRPMGWYQATLAIEPIIPLLATLPDALADTGAESRAEAAARWLQLAASSRDAVAQFAALASGLPEPDVRELPPEALVTLLLALLEINADFFVRSLPLLMERAGATLGLWMGKLQAAEAAGAAAASTTTSSA
ncbi:MAG: hypothetical protein HS128_19155 [Ideonella sp.]|nr:hypothetical protein [Ideonella sp.]MCC7455991.1 hypothetical protein [Nitrospira sp.]